MRFSRIVATFLCVVSVTCYGQEKINEVTFSKEELSLIAILSPTVLPSPPKDVTNRFAENTAAIAFGEKLFHDPRFSGKLIESDNDGTPETLGHKWESGKVSCAGCHLPDRGFSDFRTRGGEISLGAAWGKRRAPSLLDVAQSPLLMWDGRFDSFQSQIFSVIESPFEMNSSRLFYAVQIYNHYRSEYEDLFGQLPDLSNKSRFPMLSEKDVGCRFIDGKGYNPCIAPQRGGPGDNAEFDHLTLKDQDKVTSIVANAGKALGAYVRTLKCGSSRFDSWVAGDKKALSLSEKRGLKLFIGKASCMNCHTGPYFSDEKFHNIGIVPTTVAVVFNDFNDRGAATGIDELIKNPLNSKSHFADKVNPALDEIKKAFQAHPSSYEGAFKTPMLRCISSRPSFMHTGQFKKIKDVVTFLNSAGNHTGFPGKNELHPLNLNLSEEEDLVNFLYSLEGNKESLK